MSTLQATIPTRRIRVNQAAAQTNDCGHCVVTRAVLIRLRSSPYFALRTLTCEFRSGQLHLEGTVSTYFMKQMAQETIRSVDGVEQIVSRVVVKRR